MDHLPLRIENGDENGQSLVPREHLPCIGVPESHLAGYRRAVEALIRKHIRGALNALIAIVDAWNAACSVVLRK